MRALDTLVPRDFRQGLRGPLRRFYLCVVLNAVGNGLTLSFFVVYLHNVRHFSTGFATLLLSASAVAGLVASPLWGTLTDRWGPVRIILLSYATSTLALVGWAFAHTRLQAIATALALAFFGAAGWGPASTMLSRMVDETQRQRAFGFNFMLLNLGIGLGGLISASIVDLHHPFTFTLLYLLNAMVTAAAGTLFLTLRAYGHASTRRAHEAAALAHADTDPATPQGWRAVLADRRLVQFILASLVLMVGGYGSQEAGFSLFVVNNLHLSVHVIGIIFFCNTSTIVLAQLWVLNRIERRSRTRVLAVVGVLWFVFWIVLDAALALPAVLAVLSLCVAMVVFAIGETMLSPVGPALVNEISPEHLRGRYNAAAGLAYGVSGAFAPLLTALYFDTHRGNWWPLSTGLTALVGSALMLNLRRRLSPHEDGRRDDAIAA